MTRICFEQSDHTKANQATAHNRSDVGATAPEPLPRAQLVEGQRPNTLGRAEKPQGIGGAGTAVNSPKPRRHPFHTPFQDVNDDLIMDDYMAGAERILEAAVRVLSAAVIAGIATLIIVNLTR